MRRSDKRRNDLPAVRMSRELQVHRIACCMVGKIRFVGEQEYRIVIADRREGTIEVGLSDESAIGSRDPQP